MGLIFLTGMPGAGKTTVGTLLARELHHHFVDLDGDIVRRVGKTIPQIFADDGEPAFRRYESSALAEVCRLTDAVIALGAGALERDENLERITAHGLLVYLRADMEMLIERNRSMTSRPLLSDARNDNELATRLAALLERREARYMAAPIIVDQFSGQSSEELARRVLSTLSGHATR